jgi:MOSC domain-containing protein YiiM
MHSIGPYEFTTTDAERTVHFADTVFDLYGADLYGRRRDAALIEHLRPPRPTGDLAADLAAVWASWTSIGQVLRDAGQLPARHEGRVVQLNVSPGGLPKLPVDAAAVGYAGMDGDRQASRYHHGRPWQALCLWSLEVIESFREQGHDIAPGRAGENVTISGLPWDEVGPGVHLRIGEVLCEVTCFALPCSSNKAWFTGGEFNVMHHQRGPVSRVYATVLEPGVIATGDAAVLEP